MNLFLLGGTGLIGQAFITSYWQQYGFIYVVSRNKNAKHESLAENVKVIDYPTFFSMQPDSPYSIVNLSGENIASGRWNKEKKEKIYHSRVDTTKELAQFITNAKLKPSVLLQGSAIGYYDNQSDVKSDENAARGTGFLSDVVADWEAAAQPAKEHSRLCIMRTGVVLAANKGIIAKYKRQFNNYLGGSPGSGNQWFSWIHIDDQVKAMHFLLENQKCEGVFNLVSPGSLRMHHFVKTLGKKMHKPYRMPIPAFVIKLIFGEMGQTLILSGERVVPSRLIQNGFEFNYPIIDLALDELL